MSLALRGDVKEDVNDKEAERFHPDRAADRRGDHRHSRGYRDPEPAHRHAAVEAEEIDGRHPRASHAVAIERMSAIDLFCFDRCMAVSRFGIAIAARMPMIATTISSSIRVKPFCFLVIHVLLDGPPKAQATCRGRVRN